MFLTRLEGQTWWTKETSVAVDFLQVFLKNQVLKVVVSCETLAEFFWDFRRHMACPSAASQFGLSAVVSLTFQLLYSLVFNHRECVAGGPIFDEI